MARKKLSRKCISLAILSFFFHFNRCQWQLPLKMKCFSTTWAHNLFASLVYSPILERPLRFNVVFQRSFNCRYLSESTLRTVFSPFYLFEWEQRYFTFFFFFLEYLSCHFISMRFPTSAVALNFSLTVFLMLSLYFFLSLTVFPFGDGSRCKRVRLFEVKSKLIRSLFVYDLWLFSAYHFKLNSLFLMRKKSLRTEILFSNGRKKTIQWKKAFPAFLLMFTYRKRL